jgi:hypothetical protein
MDGTLLHVGRPRLIKVRRTCTFSDVRVDKITAHARIGFWLTQEMALTFHYCLDGI